MITVREATGQDVGAIRDIFLASYGTEHTDSRYYDVAFLTRLVYSDNILILIAEDSETGNVVGTGSVDLEIGAYSDLAGEFCRLAVHPDCRRRSVGKLLLSERIRRTQDRLQVGVVEARTVHPYSVRIAEAHQFAVVGFLPERWSLHGGESLALLIRHFGAALELRDNQPRNVPEIHPLATMALTNCRLPLDPIVDEHSLAYPSGGSYEVQELSTEGYAPLLRIERGRVHRREIFGPVRLHYGFFKLQARHSRYLIARDSGRIVGAVGFIHDPVEKAVRIFELITLDDNVIRFLLGELDRMCRESWRCLIEVDVSSQAPRMQRTLVELGFVPVAYLPALAFHEVRRLDVVRMVRLRESPRFIGVGLAPSCASMAELVLRQFRSRAVFPQVARAVHQLPLFGGLSVEQATRLAGACDVERFESGRTILREGETGEQLHIVLQGEVAITAANSNATLGIVRTGECLGELSLLTASPHSATATSVGAVESAVFSRQDLHELIRLRPDIGLQLYKNLAVGMGEKLKRRNALTLRSN